MANLRIGVNIHPNFEISRYEYYKKAAAEIGINVTSAQGFLYGPKNPRDTISDNAAEIIEKYVAGNGDFRLYTHGCFMDVPWSTMPGPRNFSKFIIGKELLKCNDVGSAGVIVHLAARPPSEIASVIDSILLSYTKKVNRIKDTKIFLENEAGSGQGNKKNMYYQPHEIVSIFAALKDGKTIDNVGFCLDTAHMYAAGFNNSSYESMEKWAKEWDDEIDDSGLNIFKKGRISEHFIIHLNDQFYDLGSGRDMHSPLTYGQIWREYNPTIGGMEKVENSGLAAIVEWAAERNIDCILERRPDGSKVSYNGGEYPSEDNIISDFAALAKLTS